MGPTACCGSDVSRDAPFRRDLNTHRREPHSSAPRVAVLPRTSSGGAPMKTTFEVLPAMLSCSFAPPRRRTRPFPPTSRRRPMRRPGPRGRRQQGRRRRPTLPARDRFARPHRAEREARQALRHRPGPGPHQRGHPAHRHDQSWLGAAPAGAFEPLSHSHPIRRRPAVPAVAVLRQSMAAVPGLPFQGRRCRGPTVVGRNFVDCDNG